jgi:oligoendopeptidase F
MLPPFTRASDFVSDTLNGTDWSQLEPLYNQLLTRELHCPKCLQRLLDDRSELDAVVSEAGSQLYINMTCRTDDPSTKQAYLDFVQNVQPHLKRVSFELDRRIIASPFVAQLDQARYAVFLRDLRAAVELYREENVPLETEATVLEQKYSELCGAMTVNFRGEEKTLPQMSRYMEEPDRAVREEAWRLVAGRRLADRDAIEDVFDRLVDLRQRIARNAGFANFRDYAFKARRRFDYTPADCQAFATGVEMHVVPALREIQRQRATLLGLPTLRPWDTAVDPKGRPPLRPFNGGQDLYDRSLRLFRRMDAQLADLFSALSSGGCLDLESRKGKAPGGYQANRDRMRIPFIFMNASGVQRDVETMVHEAGHAFHSLLSRAEPLFAYRSEIPLEFAEVASMSMELTSYPFLDEFYPPADADRARRNHLEGIASILPWIATIDQFQHWIYTNIGHTRAQRTQAWLDLMKRFGGGVDWSGLNDQIAHLWHRQLHLFGSPFYYIEYGIAQLGALQVYGNYRRDPAKALTDYKAALGLGGSKPLTELFSAAGIKFDFSPERISSTWKDVSDTLAALPA